jgi:ubiquinone/menaquinone biosynthesis C-methylase UbiE
MKNYWSDYWSQGYLTSFGQDIKNNYTGKLKLSWLEFTKQLKRNDKILDVGTGNGALIQLIQENNDNRFRIVGVDQAQVNDQVVKNIYGEIQANVQAESLPFADAYFDAVVAQFALEYSDLASSIPELFRVLKPGGFYQVICHELDSDIVQPNILILDSALRVEARLLPHLKVLITALAKGDTDLINKQKALINVELEKEKHIHKLAISGTQFIDFYNFVLNNPHIDLDKAAKLFYQELNGLIYRLKDLKQAAINSATIYELINQNKPYIEKLVDLNGEYIGTLYRGCKT